MSEPENFLTRWSRRKQQAEIKPDPADDGPPPELQVEMAEPGTAAAATGPHDQAAVDVVDEEKEPAVDLSSLPPVETIGADTDVRGFLQKGVPLNLTRAALSRAWAADPAIRDFIGIAENQWDFASGNVPGFGPLTAADDIARMVSQISTEGIPRLPEPDLKAAQAEQADREEQQEEPAESTSDAPGPPVSAQADQPPAQLGDQAPPLDETLPEAGPTIVHREEEFTASQHLDTNDGQSKTAHLRPHGRALPQ